MKPLSPRRRAFVEAYAGNGVEAARVAGYTGTPRVLAQMAYKLLRRPDVRSAIEARAVGARAQRIATREQRQQFWTDVMRDDAREMRDRLKASELLGRSTADFTEKVHVSGEVTLEQLVVAAIEGPHPALVDSPRQLTGATFGPGVPMPHVPIGQKTLTNPLLSVLDRTWKPHA